MGLAQYAFAFEENAISWETLPRLDHALLKEIRRRSRRAPGVHLGRRRPTG
ncbi:MAG: hypothetical protein HOI95_19230 [Chromatiales bacterium]|nr:hypothetical protein [Chromatiales bacterium]